MLRADMMVHLEPSIRQMSGISTPIYCVSVPTRGPASTVPCHYLIDKTGPLRIEYVVAVQWKLSG